MYTVLLFSSAQKGEGEKRGVSGTKLKGETYNVKVRVVSGGLEQVKEKIRVTFTKVL